MRFENGSKEVAHPYVEGQKLTVNFRYARPESLDEAVALCGTEDRLFDIVGNVNKGRIQAKTSTTAFKSIVEIAKTDIAKAEEALAAHIQAAISDLADTNAPLASTRGTGVNAKAQKLDTLQSRLAAASTDAERLAILQEMGFVS